MEEGTEKITEISLSSIIVCVCVWENETKRVIYIYVVAVQT